MFEQDNLPAMPPGEPNRGENKLPEKLTKQAQALERVLKRPETARAAQAVAKKLVAAGGDNPIGEVLQKLADDRADTRWENRRTERDQHGCFHNIGYQFLLKTIADFMPILVGSPWGPGDITTLAEGVTGKEAPFMDLGPIQPERFDRTTRGAKILAAFIPYLPATVGEGVLMAIAGPVVDAFKSPDIEEKYAKEERGVRTQAYEHGYAEAFTEPRLANIERYVKAAKRLEEIEKASTSSLKEKVMRLGLKLFVKSHYPVRKLPIPGEVHAAMQTTNEPDNDKLPSPAVPDEKYELAFNFLKAVQMAEVAAMVGGLVVGGIAVKEAWEQASLSGLDVAVQSGLQIGIAAGKLVLVGGLTAIGLKLAPDWGRVMQRSDRVGPAFGRWLFKLGGGEPTLRQIEGRIAEP